MLGAAAALATAFVGAGLKGLIDSIQWNRPERHAAYLAFLTAADALSRAYTRAWAQRDLEPPLNTDALQAAGDACLALEMAATRVGLVGAGLLLDVADQMVAMAFTPYFDSMLADSPYRDRERQPNEEADAHDLAEADFLALYKDFAERARLDLRFWPRARRLAGALTRKQSSTPAEASKAPAARTAEVKWM